MEFLILFGLGLVGTSLFSAQVLHKSLYRICQPSEVLIFAGPRTPIDSKKKVGYRLIRGGSSYQIPILEEVFRMDLTNMTIDLKVVNAYSKGGIPLTVTGVANIKISSADPIIHNAIERLLGKSRAQVENLAKETLEGNLRGVLASLTPEEANGDQIAFAQNLLEEAEEELQTLGLSLDSLQIQTISDEVGYLDSLGRKQQAELLRDARIAEAQAKAESVIQASADSRDTALRRLQRDEQVIKAEAQKLIRDALTKRVAMVTEVESIASAKIAEAKAEIQAEKERVLQVEQQLQAEVIAQAEATRQEAIAQAIGKAASIIEDGKAQAIGLQKLGESWQSAGSEARDIFLLQKIDTLMKLLAASIPDVVVDKVTIIDAKNGGQVSKFASFLEQLNQSTGINVREMMGQLIQPHVPDA